MLDWVHIWGVCRPWKNVNVMVSKELPGMGGSMWPCVVVHYHPKVLAEEWNCYRVQYLVHITPSV